MTKVINLRERLSAGQIISQLIITLVMAVVINFFMTIFGFFVGIIMSGQSLAEFQKSVSGTGDIDLRTANALKVVQFISMLGFLVTALVLPRVIFQANPIRFTGLRKRPAIFFYIVALLAFLAYMPIADLSNYINMQMKLPSWLHGAEQWMRQMEDQAGRMTEKLLTMRSVKDLIVDICLIAVLPAICEELLFRGFLQRTFYNWWGRKHLAVFLSATVFSAIHMQFYGFLPRFLLGSFLGYVFLWTGDLKVSMFVHFLNNFLSTLAVWFNRNDKGGFDINQPFANYSVPMYIFSALAGSMLLYLLYKQTRKKEEIVEDQDPVYRLPISEISWEKVYVTTRQYEAEIVAGKLEDAGIKTVIVNKQDSSYRVFGDIEVHVPRPFYQRAKEILA